MKTLSRCEVRYDRPVLAADVVAYVDDGRETVMASNLDKLESAGLILKKDLPEPHAAVVEGLTDDEVDTLLAVKRRLDDADATHFGDTDAGPGEHPRFVSFVVF
jgi:hypothetical protein